MQLLWKPDWVKELGDPLSSLSPVPRTQRCQVSLNCWVLLIWFPFKELCEAGLINLKHFSKKINQARPCTGQRSAAQSCTKNLRPLQVFNFRVWKQLRYSCRSRVNKANRSNSRPVWEQMLLFRTARRPEWQINILTFKWDIALGLISQGSRTHSIISWPEEQKVHPLFIIQLREVVGILKTQRLLTPKLLLFWSHKQKTSQSNNSSLTNSIKT